MAYIAFSWLLVLESLWQQDNSRRMERNTGTPLPCLPPFPKPPTATNHQRQRLLGGNSSLCEEEEHLVLAETVTQPQPKSRGSQKKPKPYQIAIQQDRYILIPPSSSILPLFPLSELRICQKQWKTYTEKTPITLPKEKKNNLMNKMWITNDSLATVSLQYYLTPLAETEKLEDTP